MRGAIALLVGALALLCGKPWNGSGGATMAQARCGRCFECTLTCNKLAPGHGRLNRSGKELGMCPKCKRGGTCEWQHDLGSRRRGPCLECAAPQEPKRKAPAGRSSRPKKKAAQDGKIALAAAKRQALVKYGGRELALCVAPVLEEAIAGASASLGDYEAWLAGGKLAIAPLAQLEGYFFAAQKLECLQEYDASRLAPGAMLLRLREGMAAQQDAFEAGTLDITTRAECCICIGTCAAMSDDAVGRGALRAAYGEAFLFTGQYVLLDRETVEANVREWVDLLLEHPELGAWPSKIGAPRGEGLKWSKTDGAVNFARDFNNVQSGDAMLWSDVFPQGAWPGKASPRIDAPPRDRRDTIICEIMKGPANEAGQFTVKTVVFVPRLGRYVTVSFRASRPAIVSTLSATPEQRATLRENFRAFAAARMDAKELQRLAPTVVKTDRPGNTGIIVLKFTKPGPAARLKALKTVAKNIWYHMVKPNAPVQALVADLSRGVREDFAARGIDLDQIEQYISAEARANGLVRVGYEVEDVIDLAYKRVPRVDPDAAAPPPPLPTVEPSPTFPDFRAPDPRVGARVTTYFAGDGEWFEGRVMRERTTDEGVLELRVHYDDGEKEWERLADAPYEGNGAPPVADDDDAPMQFRFVGAAPAGPVEPAVFESFGNAIRARLLALPRTCLTWPPPPGPGGGGGFRNQGNDPNQNPTFPPGVAPPYVKMSWHASSFEFRTHYG